jgi:tetratricopeptide (TPR) repeat protein
MKTHPLRCSLLAIAGLAIGCWILTRTVPGAEVAQGPAELSCILLTKEGKVELAPKGTAQWVAAATNQVLQLGDRLRTGLRSRATLRWSDLSIVRVDQLTSMEIQPPDKAGAKPQLELKSGATYFFSRERPEEIQFRTPVASGAIRGTEFNLAVAEDGRTVVSLIDGEVQLANAQGQTTLKGSEQGIVNPGRAPTNAPLLYAVNVIQWALYYPAIVDPNELGLSAAEQETFSKSLQAYGEGDLQKALSDYPENRTPASDAERLWRAALLLAVGQVPQAEADLAELRSPSPIASALRELIATVKGQAPETLPVPTTASGWMARSYTLQARSQLKEALDAALEAQKMAPNFGAASIRVAELETGFGQTDKALAALNKGLELSPENAAGLALKGFLLGRQNKVKEALTYFNRAIAADGALANGWLGRGLMKIREGHGLEGRRDLQVAAALEPQRSVLRSYLAKAFAYDHDIRHARRELRLAKKLDPEDPTPWLYSALLNSEQNRINEAIRDLEKSKELNDNRSIFRSRELLDQDLAVRGANLASIYRDVGMFETSVQEAARSVNYDYANFSSHLFLADSYSTLRDPKLINLRYETPWFNELLLANLLAPANAGVFSPNVSQQDYARLFQANHFGLFSETAYFSNGSWVENASQYGIYGNMSYSLDAFYNTDNGQRPNNELEQLNLAVRLRYQITEKDSVYAQVSYFDSESGDVAQYYYQTNASRTLQVTERQEPNAVLGYHREWSPGNHTLVLAGRFDDTLKLNASDPALLYLQTFVNPFTLNATNFLRNPPGFSTDYRSELVAYSTELQQVFNVPVVSQTLLAGVRYQWASPETSSDLTQVLTNALGQTSTNVVNQNLETDLDRFSIYAYDYWDITDWAQLTAGVSYDRLHYPVNIDTSPISSGEDTKDQVSPHVGLQVTPWKNGNLRGFYSQSLGGAFFDTSVRLEPTQIDGFLAAPRSAIPESVVGLVPATRFETYGLGWDQVFKSGTYIVVQGQILNSDATRTVGMLTNSDVFIGNAPPDSASGVRQSLEYEEQSLVVAVNQLLGDQIAVGARYRLTGAELDSNFRLPSTVAIAPGVNQDVNATLNQLNLHVFLNHPSGFFAQFNCIWSHQLNGGYGPSPIEDFWQYNIFAGYRFLQRRVEAAVGVLNLTDQDYNLNPLTLYNELPRERMFTASLKLFF